MDPKDYTPHNICRSMGLVGFEDDPALAGAETAIRVVLQPSFDPEVCITVVRRAGRNLVSVVAARFHLWREFEPAPALTYRDEGEITDDCLAGLVHAVASEPATGPGIDGMPFDAVLLREGSAPRRFEGWPGLKKEGNCCASLISAAWNAIAHEHCRNALAVTARYAGVDLPQLPTPPSKPVIETLVLGADEDRTQLLAALKHQLDR